MLLPSRDYMLPCRELFPKGLTIISKMEMQAFPQSQRAKAEAHKDSLRRSCLDCLSLPWKPNMD